MVDNAKDFAEDDSYKRLIMTSRVFHKFEQHVGFMTVSVSFICRNLQATKTELQQALIRTALEHPILRYAVKSTNELVTLVELDSVALKFSDEIFLKFSEVFEPLPNKDIVHNRLIDEGRVPSLKSQCLFTLTAVKYVDGYVFYLVVNHGVTDGTSIFAIVSSFCNNISVDTDHATDVDLTYLIDSNPVVAPRSLVSELLEDYRIKEPEDPRMMEDYSTILKFPKLNDSIADVVQGGCIRSIFLEIARNDTSAIITNCRLHKVSVQSLLSAAASLALYKLLYAAGELDAEAWNASIVHTCPVNMRRYLKDADTLSSCVSAGLTFRQPAPGSLEGLLRLKFWADLVETGVHAPLRACLDSNFPFHCLNRLEHSRPTPPATLITSSVGNITSLQEHYAAFTLENVTMQAGFYAPSQEAYEHPTLPSAMVAAGMPGHAMLHAYTVFGQLKLTGEYYAYSGAFIAQFYEEVHRVLVWAGSAEAATDHATVGDMFAL